MMRCKMHKITGIWGLGEIWTSSGKVNPGRSGAGRRDPDLDRGRLDGGVGGSGPDPRDLAGDGGDGRTW